MNLTTTTTNDLSLAMTTTLVDAYLGGDDKNIWLVESYRDFAKKADAERCVAALPKALRARVVRISGLDESEKGWREWFGVRVRIDFGSTGVTGAKNEAGIKRLRMLLKTTACTLLDRGPKSNSASVAQVLALAGGGR